MDINIVIHSGTKIMKGEHLKKNYIEDILFYSSSKETIFFIKIGQPPPPIPRCQMVGP